MTTKRRLQARPGAGRTCHAEVHACSPAESARRSTDAGTRTVRAAVSTRVHAAARSGGATMTSAARDRMTHGRAVDRQVTRSPCTRAAVSGAPGDRARRTPGYRAGPASPVDEVVGSAQEPVASWRHGAVSRAACAHLQPARRLHQAGARAWCARARKAPAGAAARGACAATTLLQPSSRSSCCRGPPRRGRSRRIGSAAEVARSRRRVERGRRGIAWARASACEEPADR